MACDHAGFEAVLEFDRYVDDDGSLVGLAAALHGWCEQCDEPLVWHPTVDLSVDGSLLHLPCRPASEDPTFGIDRYLDDKDVVTLPAGPVAKPLYDRLGPVGFGVVAQWLAAVVSDHALEAGGNVVAPSLPWLVEAVTFYDPHERPDDG